jgi:hypothetical protein
MAARRAGGPRNFESYWKMEAANVVIVPGLALALGFPGSLIDAVAVGLAMLACAGLLVIGALYWRGVDRRLRFGDRLAGQRALAAADRAERPLLALTGLAVVATSVALVLSGWAGAVIAAAVLTVLAVLEYVNYYQRQLQHFDNLADLKRLLSGRGLRASHMARALAVFRARGKPAAR